MNNYLMNKDFGSLMDSAFDNWMGLGSKFPPMNIKESKDMYTVELEIPGVDMKDIKLKVNKHVLEVSSEVHEEREEKNDDERYLMKETSQRSFSREISLGDDVNEDAITAHFNNGILNITLPKKEAAKVEEPKLIQIEAN